MQIFSCPACGTRVYFHNLTCACGQPMVFDPEVQAMTIDAAPCANRGDIGCNWRADGGGFCRSCSMTEVVPDLREEANRPLWAEAESAKRWLLATLARWGWFGPDDPGARPVFKMLSERTASGRNRVTMGHANGTITINVSEARESVLAQRQEKLGELYRTMLGHMRHETAHFLHVRLSERDAFPGAFRALFGDERADYGEALQAHYANPKPPGEEFVTSYATAHPHEDWAETLAHLLHLTDLVDSAAAGRLRVPEGPEEGYDAYAERDSDALLSHAIRLSIAINHVNRAMDLPDLYPFVLRAGVKTKLAFAHDWLRAAH